jgi:hypothetical protein
MDQLMRISLEGGGELYVELADDEPGVRRASRSDDVVDAAVESYEQRLGPITKAARATLGALREVKPDEVELEFGVRLNAAAGVVIAKTGGEGHLRVKLLWRNGQNDT